MLNKLVRGIYVFLQNIVIILMLLLGVFILGTLRGCLSNKLKVSCLDLALVGFLLISRLFVTGKIQSGHYQLLLFTDNFETS